MKDPTIWIALIGAISSMFSAVLVYMAHGKIATLEQNTNHIKDALVAKTGQLAFEQGKKVGEAGSVGKK